MKKIFKRVSAAVMALAVAATAVVFDVPQKLVAAAAVSRSSYSGEYWIDNRGNLTIYSDTGMTDWKENGFMDADDVQTVEMDSRVTSIPEGAFGFCRNLTSVEIGSGVQTIDANAFYNCSLLTEITVAAGNSTYSSADGVLFNTDKTQIICYPEGKQGSSYEIPSTVTSIEQSAFENCQQLTSVTAAEGSRLTTIESDAFNHCTALTSIEIPESVTSLGTNAFNGCKNLQNITIPAGLTSMSIDESHGTPFINCSNLTAINVAAGNTAYSSENGVLFNKDKTKLICCPEGTEDGYTIPNTVTSVGTWAFYACKKFVSVTIPNTVTSIGDKAFAYCTALTSVTIPDTVTSIGDEMFSNCNKLASVTIPNSVTSIGNKAFYNCWRQLTSVTIPNSVNSIGDEAFSSCSNLTTVTFKSTTPPTIGNTIFNSCRALDKIIVPARSADTYKAVTNLQTYQEKIVEGEADNPCGDNATWEYDETTKTLTISGTGTMTDWTSSSDVPWKDKAADIKNVVIEEGITSIGTYAFKGCSSLTSVTIPDGVDSIGSWAFDGCTELTSITIPESVTSIKTYAFQNCSQLTSIRIASGSRLKSIGTRAFYNCICLTAIDIPGSVTSINQEAFSGCTSLSSIAIPNGVTSISANTFNGCSSLSSITIPNSVTYIRANAFYNCSSLTSITIPNDVTIIDDRAFSGCSSLSSITIPGKVATIGQSAFSNCTSLSSITIPNSVNIIYATAFSGCTSLETVTFENATPPATIGTNLFNGCTNLAEILVPAGSAETYKGLERLDPYKDKIFEVAAENSCGDNATWAYDEATKTLTISGTGTMTDWTDTTSVPWADKAANIQKVVIEDGITSIGDNAFNGCSSLTNVTLPDSVTTISSGAFMSCTSLTGITIPKNVTTIGNNAFDSCTNLETVTFEGTTPPTTIGSNVFNECSSDLTINVPEGKADAYKNALTGLSDKVTDGTPDNKCGANATWALDETTKTLTISGTGDMSNWVASGNIAPWLKDTGNIGKIKNVVINEGITSVGNYAFCRCLLLTSVTIPSSVTFIGDCAFNSCSALTSITIPSSITSIGSSAFFNCGNLTSITIPKDVRSIGTSAFDRCSKLSEIIYKDGLDVSRTSIPDTATKVEYTVNNSKLNVTKITLGTDKDSFTVTNAMNIGFVAKDYRENVSQEGHTHIYSGDVCQICDCEKPDNSCGANAAWEYDETTKTLTISGTGDMTDWTAEDSAPWADKAADIEKVVIGDGITSIGDNAFEDCTSLTDVTIPDSVTDIGNGAFDGCTSLTEVTIPEGVENIGDNAFAGCTDLETVTFEGENPPIMGSDVFKDCAVDKIVVPDGSEDAYKNESGFTGLTDKITDNNGNDDGNDNACGTDATWEYDEATKTLTVTGTGDMTDWTAEDPAPWADKAADIEKVVIGDGITSIGDNAFEDCTALTEVTIPDSVTEIGDGAFDGCTSLTEVTIPEGVENIGDNAFAGCTDLETVTFEGKNPPAIGSDVFDGCDVDKIVVPEGSEDTYKGESSFTGLTDKITAGTGDNSGSDDGNTDKPENPGDNDDNNNNDSGNSGDTGNNSSDNENTSKDVLLGENVPKTDFATPTEELISAVLDPEEITQIKNSDEVSIVLEISDTVSNEDKQKVESALETNTELRFAQYMDIALYKIINDIKTQVTTTNKPIRITFEVPANLRKSGRTFGVYRVHNGETVLLPDLDNDENTVTIETDRFSTYALVYRDKASASESGNPSTGIAVSLIPLVTAAAILMIMTNRKKK